MCVDVVVDDTQIYVVARGCGDAAVGCVDVVFVIGMCVCALVVVIIVVVVATVAVGDVDGVCDDVHVIVIDNVDVYVAIMIVPVDSDVDDVVVVDAVVLYVVALSDVIVAV